MVIIEKRYSRNIDFIYRKIVDEIILVPIHKDVANLDCLYSLNPLGAFIWEQLNEPATKAEIENAILHEYDADPQTTAKDLDNFLQQMLAYGAIREIL